MRANQLSTIHGRLMDDLLSSQFPADLSWEESEDPRGEEIARSEEPIPECRFVMCPPKYLSTRVKNNVWMSGEKVDTERAMAQWGRSVNIMEAFGVPVLCIEPQKGCKDQVYTANVAVAMEPYVILSNFKAPGRDCEVEPARKFFTRLGYDTVQSPYHWEGEADLKKWKPGVYFGGVGQFSSPEAYQWMEDSFGVEIIQIEEINPKLYLLDC